ncbi:hypothetical protein [Kribbella sp. NPDC051770]|uniref:hypothetical protein n=1 Tax=Kribbella sp. NPDC051770 TaxID=3155413 RepID=UPI00342F8226
MAGEFISAHRTEDIGTFSGQLGVVADNFEGHASAVGQRATGATGTSSMAEGAAFLTSEQQARQTLGQFMTETTQGLRGYQSAAAATHQNYDGVITANTATMNALLRPPTGPGRGGN